MWNNEMRVALKIRRHLNSECRTAEKTQALSLSMKAALEANRYTELSISATSNKPELAFRTIPKIALPHQFRLQPLTCQTKQYPCGEFLPHPMAQLRPLVGRKYRPGKDTHPISTLR